MERPAEREVSARFFDGILRPGRGKRQLKPRSKPDETNLSQDLANWARSKSPRPAERPACTRLPSLRGRVSRVCLFLSAAPRRAVHRGPAKSFSFRTFPL